MHKVNKNAKYPMEEDVNRTLSVDFLDATLILAGSAGFLSTREQRHTKRDRLFDYYKLPRSALYRGTVTEVGQNNMDVCFTLPYIFQWRSKAS